MTTSTQPRFTDKVALVTGGNAGIGFAVARHLAAEGAAVVIAARRRELGEAAAAAISADGGAASFVETDVAESESVQRMVQACIDRHGRLDVAYNNAGVTGSVTTDIANGDEDLFDQVMAINVRGTWLSMKYEIRAMLAGGGGAIVNCSSGAGLRGGPKASAYYGSKHAVIGLTKAVAHEYADRDIRVNAVCPGLVMTDIIAINYADAPEKMANIRSRIPMQRSGAVEEISEAVMWLASSQSSYVTGVALPVDGGYNS